MTTLGTMKVVDIQDKQGYSLVTFEIPDDCKQFLIEYAICDLLTKAAEETKQKYGSVLPETVDRAIPTTLGLDKPTSQVYNENEADDAGWIPNTGKQPVDDDVLVEVIFKEVVGFWKRPARRLEWEISRHPLSITHWRLSKQE